LLHDSGLCKKCFKRDDQQFYQHKIANTQLPSHIIEHTPLTSNHWTQKHHYIFRWKLRYCLTTSNKM